MAGDRFGTERGEEQCEELGHREGVGGDCVVPAVERPSEDLDSRAKQVLAHRNGVSAQQPGCLGGSYRNSDKPADGGDKSLAANSDNIVRRDRRQGEVGEGQLLGLDGEHLGDGLGNLIKVEVEACVGGITPPILPAQVAHRRGKMSHR